MKKTFAVLIMFLTVATLSGQSPLTITVKDKSFKMIYVQGGTFTMGCTSEQEGDCHEREKPTHKVTLSTYYIGETEVTRELWKAVMGDNPSLHIGSKYPVEFVGWDDCQEFARKLNELTGLKFRLPTEAEWEFAARGGMMSKGYKYSGSDDIDAVAWYDMNAYDKGEKSPGYGTHVVKTKKPNELGIYDMSGNVEEWCSDYWSDDAYTDSAQTNPQGPATGYSRVNRGGSWQNDAWYCRSSSRYFHFLDGKHRGLGLRLVLVP